MNVFRKKAAVNKYGQLKEQGAEVIAAALQQDPAAYNQAEIEEIVQQIFSPGAEEGENEGAPGAGGAPDPSPAGRPAPKKEEKAAEPIQATTKNLYFEEHHVEPQFKTITNEFSGETKQVLRDEDKTQPGGGDKCYEKVGRPIRGTWITQDSADLLNQHSRVSKRRFFRATPPAPAK
jgi:hypothetical protein